MAAYYYRTHPSMHGDVVISGLNTGTYLFILGSLADDDGGPATSNTAACDCTTDTTTTVASTVIGHCGRRVEVERSLRRAE